MVRNGEAHVVERHVDLAALDVKSDVDEVQLQSGLQELKSRLEELAKRCKMFGLTVVGVTSLAVEGRSSE